MKKRVLKNVVASVRNRLLTVARQSYKPFQEVLILNSFVAWPKKWGNGQNLKKEVI